MKHFLLIVLSLLVSSIGFAQLELTGMGGFNFGGTLNTTQGELKLRDGADWVAGLSYRLNDVVSIEISYTGMQTNIDHLIRNAPDESLGRTDVSYFMIGTVKELNYGEPFRPFGTITLGGAWYNSVDNLHEDFSAFAFAAGLGFKYFFSDRIGIRVQSRLLAPLWGAGIGISCGSGGCGGGVSSSSLFVSGDITGGLIIALD